MAAESRRRAKDSRPPPAAPFFQEAHGIGALFPICFGVLAPAIGCAPPVRPRPSIARPASPAEQRRRAGRTRRRFADTRLAAEQPLEPTEEPPARRVGSRLRRCRRRHGTAGSLRLPARSSRLRRPGGGSRRHARACRSLHLLVVAAQDGVRRRRSGRLLHLLVMPVQNGIRRYRAHDRLLVESAPAIVTKKSSSIRGPPQGASMLRAGTRPERCPAHRRAPLRPVRSPGGSSPRRVSAHRPPCFLRPGRCAL